MTDHKSYRASKGLWIVTEKVCKHIGLEELVSKSSLENSGVSSELVMTEDNLCVLFARKISKKG